MVGPILLAYDHFLVYIPKMKCVCDSGLHMINPHSAIELGSKKLETLKSPTDGEMGKGTNRRCNADTLLSVARDVPPCSGYRRFLTGSA